MRNTLSRTLFVALTALGFSASAVAQTEAPPPAHAATGRAAVVATNEGEIEPAVVRSMAHLLATSFSELGVSVVESHDLESPVQVDAQLASKLQAAGAERVYLLHVLRLDDKVLLQLDERGADGLAIAYSTGLVPSSVDSANEVLPRLARAVLHRLAGKATADASNVTHEEQGTHNRGHFVLGFPGGFGTNLTAGGVSAGFQYETGQFAVGAAGMMLVGTGDLFYGYGYGVYYFTQDAISPYASVGMGVEGFTGGSISGVGPAALAELGVELLRFQRMHFDIAAQGLFPLFKSNSTTTDPNTFDTITQSSYTPAFLLAAKLQF